MGSVLNSEFVFVCLKYLFGLLRNLILLLTDMVHWCDIVFNFERIESNFGVVFVLDKTDNSSLDQSHSLCI